MTNLQGIGPALGNPAGAGGDYLSYFSPQNGQ